MIDVKFNKDIDIFIVKCDPDCRVLVLEDEKIVDGGVG